jgi:hypothetical protein
MRRELFINGNFDSGGTGWTEIGGNGASLIVTPAMAGGNVMPQSGAHFAKLGGYLGMGEDNLIATVEVPASATNLVFSLYSIVTTEEASSVRVDSLFMSLDATQQFVEETIDNTAPHAEWKRYEKSIDPAAAGNTLVMLVRAENDAMRPTTFFLDSVSLTANICP